MKIKTGFTLIELLIAVAIVGILTAVALPSYQEHVRKSKRAEGKAALLKAVQLQERTYIVNSTYVDNANMPPLFGQAISATLYSGEDPANAASSYTITVDAPAGTCTPLNVCVALRATPNGSFTDPACGQLTLTSMGVRGKTGTAQLNNCW